MKMWPRPLWARLNDPTLVCVLTKIYFAHAPPSKLPLRAAAALAAFFYFLFFFKCHYVRLKVN